MRPKTLAYILGVIAFAILLSGWVVVAVVIAILAGYIGILGSIEDMG